MTIRLITLFLFSKKLFLLMLFIILLPIYTFSMQHLTRKNYSTFLKDKEIHNTIAQIKKIPINEPYIDENHYLEQKKVHLELLSTFFPQLTGIIETVINKQDTWLLFLCPDVAIDIPWTQYLTYYYQKDIGFTTFFIDSINNLFNSIENKNESQNAKICTFFSINRYTKYTNDTFVLWNQKTNQAFFYVPKKLNENNGLKWYNIVPEVCNPENNPLEPTDTTNIIKKASYFYFTVDNPFFTYGILLENLIVITAHNTYENRQITDNPSDTLVNNKNPIIYHYLKTYCKYLIPVSIILLIAVYQSRINDYVATFQKSKSKNYSP